MTRSDRWKEPQYAPLSIQGVDDNPALMDAIRSAPNLYRGEFAGESRAHAALEIILKTSKEVILRCAGEKYALVFVGYALDASRGCLVLSADWTMFDMTEDDVKQYLALAMTYEIPVYPDDSDAQADLTRIYEELLDHGYESPSTKTRMVYSGKRGVSVDNTGRWAIDATESVSPADILVARSKAAVREWRLEEAEAVLSNLRTAIDGLESLLSDAETVELDLQAWLTNYPILFGLQYKRVRPQHKLGAEYVMDYALEHVSGNYDLVEIEDSKHALYTKAKNPSAALTHAEQQVLDWLDWTERHSSYARESMPALVRPSGFVVIGRRSSLNSATLQKLERRNRQFGGALQVLTYDDLVDRARTMLDVLTARSSEEQSE